jgi:ABC-type transport system substrate-binding protein
VLISLGLLLSIIPVNAWVKPGPYNTDDGYYEDFGPRIDRILCKMYATQEAEWDALEKGEIDISDWPLTDYYITRWSQAPFNESIKLINYGGESGFYLMDINNNPNPLLGYYGNLTDYANPMYPNPTAIPAMRHAIAHLTDRSWIVTEVTAGLGVAIYTPIPSYMVGYVHPDIKPGEIYDPYLTHPYDPSEAAAILDQGDRLPEFDWPGPYPYMVELPECETYNIGQEPTVIHVLDGVIQITSVHAGSHGYFVGQILTPCIEYPFDPNEIDFHADTPVHFMILQGYITQYGTTFPMGPDGWRYWDRNCNGIKDTGEDLSLRFYARSDDSARLKIGDRYNLELTSAPIKIHVDYRPNVRAVCSEDWMALKAANLYTGGWIGIGPDPDYIYNLFHTDFYDHPGKVPNTAFFGKNKKESTPSDPGVAGPFYTELDDACKAIAMAATPADATAACMRWQELWCDPGIVPGISWWSYSGIKASRIKYSGDGATIGPEDKYEGKNWVGQVNQAGFGTNSWWSTLNAHPEGYDLGDGQYMTMRYGFKSATLDLLNPIYATWYWDWEVMGRCYDSMLARDPYTLLWRPYIAYAVDIGTYGPDDNTMVTYHLYDDVYFSDGVQLTSADVAFTLKYLPDKLAERGLPDPFWISNVLDIVSVDTPDAYTVVVKFDVYSCWAMGWAGGNVILPQHLWQSIVDSPGNPVGFSPEPTLTGSGPFIFQAYVPSSYVLMTPFKRASPNGFAMMKPDCSRLQGGVYVPTSDSNADGYINVKDIVIVSAVFGLDPSTTDPRADRQPDNFINVKDIVLVSSWFGGIWSLPYPTVTRPWEHQAPI